MSQFGSGPMASPPPGATLRYAGFWIRFLASVVDAILLNMGLGLISLVFGFKLVDYDFNADTGSFDAATGTSGASALSFLIAAGFSIGFWLWRAATPGKMLFSMQVVRADTGMPISAGQAIGRYLGYFVSGLVLMLGSSGPVSTRASRPGTTSSRAPLSCADVSRSRSRSGNNLRRAHYFWWTEPITINAQSAPPVPRLYQTLAQTNNSTYPVCLWRGR